MEIEVKCNVVIDVSDRLAGILTNGAVAATNAKNGANLPETRVGGTTVPPIPRTAKFEPAEAAVAVPEETPAETSMQTPVQTATPEPAPAVAPVAPVAPADAPAEPRKEQPEDVIPLLRQRFGIPENKEDRNEEQNQMSKALNKCVVGLIREVTKNSGARSLADLRDDQAKHDFIDAALRISYSINDGTFSAMPF